MAKLIITIPTFNRPFFIQRQVRDVLPQLREGVSLVVYDNCSDPSVESLFTEEEKSLFRIERNIINIGGGANLGRCLSENVDGWVWLLGDDDKIRPDAVDVILQLISEHPDFCYINTANKRTEEVTSFDSFINYFKMRGAYGKAFFQSACIFNMTLLKDSIGWYYDFLSSMMGQLMFVIKYMEEHDEGKAFFTTCGLITDKEEGGWNPTTIILNSATIIDRFDYCRGKMKSNIFASLGNMYLDSIACLKGKERRHYLKFAINRIGIINILRYNLYGIGYFIIKLILPPSVSRRIHDNLASKYNKAQGRKQ